MRFGISSFRTLVLILVLIPVAAASGEAAAATLYGAAHVGADNPSTLYRIDSTTGVATAIGPIGFDEVGGIDFHPDGRLYGVGKRPGPNTWVLIQIDPDTGAGTEVDQLQNTVAGSGHYDVSFHSDGTLYLTADSQVNPCVSLFTVDLITGVATEVGDTTVCSAGNAMRFSRDDVLSHANTDAGGTLYTVDQVTGASGAPSVGLTYVGFPVLAEPKPNAMDVDPDTGTTFVSVDDGTAGSGPNYLATLDPATGNVTHVGLSVSGLDALAWRPSPCVVSLYGTAHTGGPGNPSTLYRLNASDGVAVAMGPVGFDRVTALDFHPVNGVLYGVGERPSDGTHVLIRINPVSGEGTEVGPLVNSFSGGGHFDLSFRGSDDELFLAAFKVGVSGVHVYTVDIETGLATEVGPTTTDDPGNGMAFSRDDTLYHVDKAGGGTLYTVDQATGASTSLGFLTYTGFQLLINQRINAMDFKPDDGTSYVSVNDGSGGIGPNYLATLDPSSLTVSHVGRSVNGLTALAWRMDCTDYDVCTDDRCKQCDVTAGPCTPTCALFGSVHAGSDGLSTLYRIDASTGAAAPIGPIGFERVGSIDFDAGGTLYGVGERDDGSNAPVLIAIDPSTGAGTEIGALVTTFIGGGHFDVSFRNADGLLHLTAFDSAGGNVALFTVDTTTGFATEIGNLGTNNSGNALAFSPGDTLYHTNKDSGGTLYVVDQVTGAAGSPVLLTHPGLLTNPTHTAMEFDPCSGTTYAAIKEGTGSAADIYLGTVDTATGNVTVIGQTATSLSGLAFYRAEATCCHTPLAGPVVFPHPLDSGTDGTPFEWFLPEDVVMVKGDLGAVGTYGTISTTPLTAATSFTDGDPAPGAGFYYLLRGDCPAASWSSGGPGECAPPGFCPAGERDGNLP